MSKSTEILYEESSESLPQKTRKPRIDYNFERMVLSCAIGCIIRDMPMTETDYARLYLAISRLSMSMVNYD